MQFVVTGQDLITGANACISANAEIQGQIGHMQSLIDGLMGSYQGIASLQLKAIADMWQGDSTQLNIVLETIAKGLNGNAQNYVGGETANASNLAGIAANLPVAKF